MTAVLELRDVSKVYGSGATEVQALRSVDLTVRAGELVAIMGPSGSGKSTLLTIAGTLEEASTGDVLIAGAAVSDLSRNERAGLRRRSIGYVFQDFNLLAGLTALENVTLPMELDGVAAKAARAVGLEALRRFDIADKAGRYPDELSGGERQRVAVARAIAGDRRLLLADEPTGALDSVNGEGVMRLVRAACREGVAGVIVTHDAQLASWADRIVFIRDGRVVDQTAPLPGPESLLTRARRHEYRHRGGGGARVGARAGRGGRGTATARRAVVRWAWRLFRREWRQQLFVLALLIVAVAATTAGVALATAATPPAETTFTLPGADPQLAADVAAIQQAFGNIEVFTHQTVPVPGSVATVDLRAQDLTAAPAAPAAAAAAKTLRLLAGRYPSGAGEVAVTHGVADTFDLRLGGTWTEGGRALQVVGVVENPLRLSDDFGLLAPGQIEHPSKVTVHLAAAPHDLSSLHLPGGRSLGIEGTSAARTAAAATVLALATICLLFIGLVAVAGFTVMAQRRQRALGMLGAVGASDRHVRLVMVANGAVVGGVAAVIGAATGLAGWLAFAPRLETLADHRIDRFALPWWAIGSAAGLAVLTAVAAAWWPARAAARLPIVAALSGRPPRPRPAHRSAAVGGLVLAGGLLALAFAHQGNPNPPLIIAGTVATTLGALLFAPLGVRTLGVVAGRAPVAVRLALRNLARYQARTGAALGAITLVVGIAATIGVSARSAEASSAETAAGGNLPANEIVVYVSDNVGAPLAAVPSDQLQTLQARVTDIATSLHTTDVVALDGAATAPATVGEPAAVNSKGSGGHVAVVVGSGAPPAAIGRVTPEPRGFRIDDLTPLYVATPEILAHYGIKATEVDPTADVLSSEPNLAGFQVVSGRDNIEHPKIQTVALPRYTSDPNSLITTHAVQTLGLQVLPAGWLIRSSHALSPAQVDAARRLAATAGLTIEARSTPHSLTRLGQEATAVAVLLVLGVLAMVVGLLRTEAAGDLRTLTAAGAGRRTRRALTATTAGALALLGATLGTAGAYLALVAWYRRDLGVLSHVPVANLAVILVGLPLVAVAAGWLLAGREPSAISRRPLE